MKCKKCKSEIPDDSVYCYYCMSRVKLNFDEIIERDGIINLDEINDSIIQKSSLNFLKQMNLKELEEILFNNFEEEIDDDDY